MKTIPLTTRRRRNTRSPEGLFAIVDDDDYDLAMRHKWHASKPDGKTWYAKSGNLLLHRVVMGLQLGDGKQVDHKDRNGLNCQKTNLRIATGSQNKANVPPRGKSKIKGVRFKRGAWEATVRVAKQKQVYLGRFPTAQIAAEAYDTAAFALYGEFAWLNRNHATYEGK